MARSIIKKKLATLLLALDRGKYWLSYINFILILFLTVSNIKEYSNFKFMNSFYLLIVLTIFAFIMTAIFGYIDLKKGVYKQEMEIQAQLNPIQRRMLREIDGIYKRTKKRRK